MPEIGFSLQIEVYFVRGTYEFARPDHPNAQSSLTLAIVLESYFMQH